MKVRINEPKGVTVEITAALHAEGITTSEHLLAHGGQPKARAELAAKLGVSERVVLKMVNRADLSRIRGVAGVYSHLLEGTGVDTVTELRNRVPENLHVKLQEVADQHGVKRIPRLDELRRLVQIGLNKGEAKNSLARTVFLNRLGELRDRSFENQRYRASGLNVVVAATLEIESAPALPLPNHGALQARKSWEARFLSPALRASQRPQPP